MVVVRLTGGLGNQLFQYAAALGVALRAGAPLSLDLDWYQGPGSLYRRIRSSSAARAYELDAFNVRASAYPRRRFSRATPPNAYDEKHFHFDPGVTRLSGGVYLRGNFQSEKYFADAEREVRKDLTFCAPPAGQNAMLLRRIAATPSVSLHVRRGDYVSNRATLAYHGNPGVEYYQRAIAFIRERVDTPHFYVFSDDLDWCKAHLRCLTPAHFVDINSSNRSYEDLRLMAACQHHIIANSTFGWWGAWLNPSTAKLVVAPSRWFATNGLDSSDLVPEAWTKL